MIMDDCKGVIEGVFEIVSRRFIHLNNCLICTFSSQCQC